MGRLEKYWFYKYPYYVTLSIDVLPNNIIGRKFKIEDNVISFITNKKGIKILNEQNISYEVVDNHLINVKKLLSRRLVGLFCLFIVLLLMLFSNHYIRSIEFENELYYNYEVYSYIEKKLNKVGNIYLTNYSLNDLSIEMRNEFNYYSFIGLIKDNGILKIKIIPNVPINKNPEKNNFGLYAAKNAYIIHINVNSGINLVNYHQMVKKDELLVEGMNCDGVIIGRTIEIENLAINKKNSKTIYTGNVYKDRYLQIVKFSNKKTFKDYKDFFVSEKNIINWKFLKVIEISYYELKEIIEYNNFELIKINIKQIYEQEFYKSSRVKEEKVISVKILTVEEDEEKYYLKLLTTKLENIVRE